MISKNHYTNDWFEAFDAFCNPDEFQIFLDEILAFYGFKPGVK